MALCVALLIASEFMPVSLLTPIAHDLHATDGMAGQAISISGLFAVVTSLLIATFAARFDRRHVLIGLTAVMLLSLVVIAMAPNFLILMIARALLGIVIGGFWSLATATVMRLVPAESIPKALGIVYTGNAVATAFAAPIGSYLGGIIGWRGVFWAMTPFVVANLIWQWISLPSLAPQKANPMGKLVGLLKRRNVAFAMLGVMLTFAGAFTTFTYLRPFLETYTRRKCCPTFVALACAWRGGIRRHLLCEHLGRATSLLAAHGVAARARSRNPGPACHPIPHHWSRGRDVCLGCLELRHSSVLVDLALEGYQRRAGERWWTPVGAIQLSIMLGGAFGGFLLDHISVAATFIGGTALLVLATSPSAEEPHSTCRSDARSKASILEWKTRGDSAACLSESGD